MTKILKASLKKISFSLYLMKLLRIFLASYTPRRPTN